MLGHIRTKLLSACKTAGCCCCHHQPMQVATKCCSPNAALRLTKNFNSLVSSPQSYSSYIYFTSHQAKFYKYAWRSLHTSSSNLITFKKKTKTDPVEESRITRQGYFKTGDRNKNNFIFTLELYKEKEKLLRGHVEFIEAALLNMEEFGVHKDLEVYKKLLDVFPKVKMIPQNMWQVEFMHYPIQQNCALDVLCQMEQHGVIPDSEVEDIIMMVFGKHSHPMKRYGRMNYWMHKFNNASPWPLPKPVPDDGLELAKLAVARMCSVDQASEISILSTKDVKDAIDDTWIVSGQSIHQQELMEKQPEKDALKLRGPFRIFLREQSINYYTLTADYRPPPVVEPIDKDDISLISSLLQADATLRPNTAVSVVPSVHEQRDGTILAICVTGTSSRDSLLSWVRLLSDSNPPLARGLPVIFLQTSPEEYSEVATLDEQQQKTGVTTDGTSTAAHDHDERR